MNYIVFSDKKYNFGKRFKEVDVNEKYRIDAIIADFDYICSKQSVDSNSSRRNKLLDEFIRFCSLGGELFILLEANENILYNESNEFQTLISRIQRETSYKFEFRSICSQTFKEEQQIEKFKCFVIFYNDNTLVFNDAQYSFCEKNYNINTSNNKYLNIIDYVFSKIEENLL